MKSKNRILRVFASLLLLTTLLVSVFAPAASATQESASLINRVDKEVNTDYSQFYNPAVLYALPEGVEDEEEISLIIRSKEDTLLDAYDKSSSPLSFSEYCKTDEAKSIVASIDKNNERLIDMLDTAKVRYTVGEQYTTLVAGFEIVVKAKYFEEVCNTLGRDATIIVGEVYEPADAKVVENEVDVYDTGIFNSANSRFDGSGMVVAVLDTGCDYTHSVFSVNNFTSENLGMTFAELATLVDKTTASTFHESMTTEDVFVNVKIPYAYDYADKDTDVMPLSSEHGTHVAGIIAGKDADDKQGDRITGVAPNAQLAIMKVFSDFSTGAKTSWMMAALEDCVKLGVDVINMSLGASYGFSRDLDNARMNEIYDSIRARGISLVVAAGNSYNSTHGSEKNGSLGLTSNPDSATVGSPSTYDASLSVASIEGVVTYYLLFGDRIIYYTEAADRVSEDKNFVEDLIGDSLQPVSYEFVLIPGVGREADYTGIDVTGKIALVQRGNTTFEEKANTAEDMGAAGVIIYNNVSGEIKMTVGDTKIAVCSISQDDGEALAAAKTGKITVSRTQAAGPFMSSFSSWGTGPDLSIKPEITAHGGSILSAVPGQGYERLSGTSMAAPNMAGVATLLRQYVIERFFANEKDNFGNLSAENQMKVTAMVNRLAMSTADIVINKNGLPYSVRKQGAGLVNLASSTNTGAYILTYDRHDGSVMDKAKIELGDDPTKSGVYTLKFAIDNFGSTTVSYDLSSYVMTEGVSKTLTTDGKTTVTEEGYILEGAVVELVGITGGTANGKSITVAGGSTAELTVKITLSDADKKYLNDSFENGMYVEGYLMLNATGATTVDLSVPYLAFYGDWTEAPIFDIDFFETNKDELDDSIDLLDKTLPDAYATRVLGGLYDDYISYLGAYYYIQKPGSNKIAADRKYISISNQEKAVNNIRSVWAGLLRNCERVEIVITEDATGEVVHTRTEYGIRKSPSNGSTIYGSTIDIEFSALEHDLKNNSAYTVTLQGFLDYEGGGAETNDKNTFTFPFVTDFEAPTVTGCEFYTEYDKSTKTNRLYAKIAVYDNHYSMAMIPGYIYEKDSKYNLTNFDQYPNQIYSSFNSTSYVVYELTDYIDDIKENAYNKNSFTVALLDYAMNESLYEISLPSQFVDLYFEEESVTLSPNQTYKLNPIVYPNTEWAEMLSYTSSDESVVKVVKGELVAVGSGEATVEASIKLGGSIHNVKKATIPVTVLAEGDPGYRRYDKPIVSHFALTGYETIKAYYMQASEDRDIGLEGSKQVFYTTSYNLSLFPSETVKLTYELVDYFDNTEVVFKSSNSNIVTVDEDGTIKGVAEGFASVSVRIKADGKDTYYTKTVNITVKDPYETMGPWLMHYYGLGGKVVIPEDLYMTEIYEYAFSNCKYIPKDLNAGDVINEEDPLKTKPSPIGDDTITEIVIPEGVKKIGAFAFANLTALEKVTLPSTLVTIDQGAFAGCTSLTLVAGLQNVKFINAKAFQNCDLTGEYEFSSATAISDRAFEGNKHLSAITLPASAQSIGAYTFADCEKLATVEIEAEKIKLGAYAFSNCTSLTEISLNASVIPAGTFSGCTKLSKMTIGKDVAQIGEYAFRNTKITSFTLDEGNETYTSHEGGKFFTDKTGTRIVLVAPAITTLTVSNAQITTMAMGAVAGNSALVSVNIPSVTKVEKYAFADCTSLMNVSLGTLTEIGDYAFYRSALATLPSLVAVGRIGDYAFSGTDLVSVTIPEGITVGKYAFADCEMLKTVVIGNNVKIGDYAFTFDREAIFNNLNENLAYYQKNGKTYYYIVFNTPITSLTIGDGVTVGAGAFANNGRLEAVTLGEGVKIGDQAFYNCMSLATIDLSKVTEIGKYAFAGDALREFFVEKKVDETDGVEKNTLVPAYETVDNSIFYTYASRTYGAPLTNVDLSSVTSLGSGAFMYCKKLTAVTLGDGVTVIPENAFAECAALATIDLSGITEIGKYAFAGTAIASADLSSVIEIGDLAFTHCKNLTEITLGESISEIGKEGFYNCTSLATVNGLAKVKRIDNYAFANTALVRVDLSSAEYIGDHAFMKESAAPFVIQLGESLSELGENPFANCILTKLSKKEDVLFNGNKVETKTLYTYDISDTVKVIDGSLYRVVPKGLELITYCGDGESFRVADKTVRISAMAFAGAGLKSVALPYTVRAIGHKALYGCEDLTVVTFTSYNAPILEEQYDHAYFANPDNWPGTAPGTNYGMGLIEYKMWGVTQYPSNTFYGANFVDYLGKLESEIVMVRPSNGLNYNTFILDTYFATVIDGKPAADAATLLAIEAISRLPETVSLSDEALVLAARAAYDKVANTEQRSLVTEYAKLTKAEKRIADLKYLENENQPTPDEPTPEAPVVPDEKSPVGKIILIVSLSVVGVALIVLGILFGPKLYKKLMAKLAKKESDSLEAQTEDDSETEEK